MEDVAQNFEFVLALKRIVRDERIGERLHDGNGTDRRGAFR